MTAILPYLVHGANFMYLASYLVRDILWLRVFTIIAGSSLVPYYFFQPQPLWEPIIWNVVFISINVVQSILLVIERQPVLLKGDELALYRLAFDRLTPRGFKKLLMLGRWQEIGENQKIVSEDEIMDEIYILFDGELAVQRGGSQLAKLSPGSFVGEMSYLTGQKASADVVALCPTRQVAWRFSDLETFLPKHPDLRAAFQNILGSDLVRKLNPR